MQRRLVWVVYACEVFDLALSGSGVHPLGVARFANFERGVNENFYERVVAHHVANVVACGAIGTDGCADGYASVTDYLGCYEAYAANVGVAVFFGKTQTGGKMRAHNVAVQKRYAASSFKQQDCQNLRDG